MATHSSILAWRIPMDRGAWRTIVHGVRKTEQLTTAHSTKRTIRVFFCFFFFNFKLTKRAREVQWHLSLLPKSQFSAWLYSHLGLNSWLSWKSVLCTVGYSASSWESHFLGRLIRSLGVPKERGVWNSQGGRMDKLFSPLHSLRLYNNVFCLRTVSGLNLLANSVNYGSRPALYKDYITMYSAWG